MIYNLLHFIFGMSLVCLSINIAALAVFVALRTLSNCFSTRYMEEFGNQMDGIIKSLGGVSVWFACTVGYSAALIHIHLGSLPVIMGG